MKFVMVFRSDLKMSAGKMVAQGGHAVQAMLQRATDVKSFRKWRKEGGRKVALKADEGTFSEIVERLQASNLVWGTVTDAGKTEVEAGSVTCLWIGPASDPQIDSVTGKLTLL